MSFSGMMRSLAAAERRRERESRRRQRELEKRQKEIARMEELERARYEVEVFENYLDVLMSIHKESGPVWDWSEIVSSSPPPRPERGTEYEISAKKNLEQFKPDVADKLLRRTESKRDALKEAVELAVKQDDDAYQDALRQHEIDLMEWNRFKELGSGILAGSVSQYVKAVEAINPFAELSDLGSSVKNLM